MHTIDKLPEVQRKSSASERQLFINFWIDRLSAVAPLLAAQLPVQGWTQRKAGYEMNNAGTLFQPNNLQPKPSGSDELQCLPLSCGVSGGKQFPRPTTISRLVDGEIIDYLRYTLNHFSNTKLYQSFFFHSNVYTKGDDLESLHLPLVREDLNFARDNNIEKWNSSRSILS